MKKIPFLSNSWYEDSIRRKLYSEHSSYLFTIFRVRNFLSREKINGTNN
jgi:hypothetical protein